MFIRFFTLPILPLLRGTAVWYGVIPLTPPYLSLRVWDVYISKDP